MPTAVVPVAPEVGRVIGDHDEMEHPHRNREIASRAEVLLGRLVRLDGADRYVEKMAHAMTAMVAASAITTIAISAADFS